MALLCPNDGTTLENILVEDVPVDRCPNCGGHWLDRAELEALQEKHGADVDPVEIGAVGVTESTRKCPLDGTTMRAHEFAEHTNIRIDQCPNCQGIWLDRDELEQILAYFDQHPEHEPTLSQRIMLFLYALTERPPYI